MPKIIDPYKFGGGAPVTGGKCWEFNGTNEYITIPDDDTLSFNPNRPLTVSAWIKMDSSNRFRVFSKGASQASCEYTMATDTANQLGFSICDANFSNRHVKYTNVLAYVGAWTHFCFTVASGASSSSAILMYIDGSVIVGTGISPGTYTAMDNTTGGAWIGRFLNDTTNLANGRMAEIILWDKELSAVEVADVYNGGSPRDETSFGLSGNIISYWQAQNSIDGAGGVLDTVGGNHGTFVNMTQAGNVIADFPT